MAGFISIVVLIIVCVNIGIFIAGANPKVAARWDVWRRKAFGIKP